MTLCVNGKQTMSNIVNFCQILSNNEPTCKRFRFCFKKATQTSLNRNGNSTVVVLSDKETHNKSSYQRQKTTSQTSQTSARKAQRRTESIKIQKNQKKQKVDL